ncbi:aldehyde dehydrogenase family protein [Paraconexibacter antarcticus]|uniref:Aldehyde dehydrogenase n=1 Tax=Paraconexibacter antarcticus TaxID=2949664 RepID=A0ABY5DRF7_9ACTN|nr:aldehyde dehydrogenase family protein [Paraconexibacter antarcticus]UTI63511.1 aldehyde dehydrogenase family protein [Paraconexibacter antarcticus]
MTDISVPPASAAARTIDVEDPARGTTIGSIPVLDERAVQELAARARMAQVGWHGAGFAARAGVMDRARAWLIENSERMSTTISSETGKTFEDSQLEISIAAQSLKFWSKNSEGYLADEKVGSFTPFTVGKKTVVRYEPVGLVGVIGPWNYPLVNAFCDCVPALMAGNSVLLKPSEVTPLTALLTAEMLEVSGMPKDVFSVATGDGETGGAIVDAADYVMFTGSTKTGKAVMKRAADTLTQVSLELGGKDPMIVCADADLDRAANAAAYYGLLNGGQVCISVERVYVEAPVHDEFVAKLVKNVKELRQGVPGAPGTVEVGAVTFPPQIDLVEQHVQDAVAQGAKVEVGGHRGPGPGRFFEPTVLTGVTHQMRCMREETFGPTIPVMAVADVEEAIRMANDSEYGLQGSVFTKDVAKGEAIARRIEAGAVLVNDALLNYAVMDAPMGGWKTSGVGSRHGANGIRKYCKTQTIVSQPFVMKKDLNMYPYKPWRSNLLGRVVKAFYGR